MPEREVIAAPLPNWKDLVYAQLDVFYEQAVQRQIVMAVNAGGGEQTVDLFMSNIKSMAEVLERIRARVAAEPNPVV